MSKRPHDLVIYGHGTAESTTAQPAKKARKAQPIYTAKIVELAEGHANTNNNKPDSATNIKDKGTGTSTANETILERIAKCLARGNHESTPENEAKAALHMASRLMKQHNVTQAEMLAREIEASGSSSSSSNAAEQQQCSRAAAMQQSSAERMPGRARWRSVVLTAAARASSIKASSIRSWTP